MLATRPSYVPITENQYPDTNITFCSDTTSNMNDIAQRKVPPRLRCAAAIGDTRWLSITNALNAFLDNYGTLQQHYQKRLRVLLCARLKNRSRVTKADIEAVSTIVTKLQNKSLAAEAHGLAWMYDKLTACSKCFQDPSMTLVDLWPLVDKLFNRLCSVVLAGVTSGTPRTRHCNNPYFE